MKVADTWLHDVPDTLAEDDELRCPDKDCGEWSPLSEWEETEAGCEDCGSHHAMRCPKCGEAFDHVWGPTFESRRTAPPPSETDAAPETR